MNREGTAGILRVVRRRVAATTIAILVVLLHATPAYADNVDTLIGQLDDDSDKVRLSATLNLTKLGDQRAILPLITRLVGSGNRSADSDKNVRGAAAVGLGKLVTDKVKGSLRGLAIKALQNAEVNDSSEFVKAQAGKALAAVSAGVAPVTPGPSGGVYVNIGPMSSKTATPADPKYRTMMMSTATKTMSRVAANLPTTWPGGGVPSKAMLDQKSIQGFYIDGTLNTVDVQISGSSSTISCKISMLLASYPDKSVFGFLNGGARVQASAGKRDVELASEDCVSAVVEELISKKIVPTIKTKAGIP